MWDNMAAISIQHLKPNDFIHVSGRLESYTKTDLDGKLITHYKVDVKKLNFVAQRCTPKQFEKSELEREEARLERYKNQVHLWQVFFTNPFEWWDNRKTKKGPKYPDFCHKDTDEALWINPNDPPWIKRQLELHDSRMAERGLSANMSRRSSRVSMWEYDE